MDGINNAINFLNTYLWHEVVIFALLITGLAFTIWTKFGQYRALTHGFQVIRGKYDKKGDPGAINHFQALSAALSATVGLGNIAGVAVAVALGGPGAILWMWVIGIVGMALKMTEVTQSMLYRNLDDPQNPHGGPMFVVREGFKKWGLGQLGSFIGGIFVITLIISTITGGNMFQAWNVAEVTRNYFDVNPIVTTIILSVVVGLVIIGGIKRIGAVAGRLVPIMCALYLLAGLFVIGSNLGAIPELLGLIVRSGLPEWLGGEPASATGAFLGGTFGYAAMWGIKRALFSSEAGQGSAPIAHSAARTDEPVREGVVAGLEPFIDTLVVCTITALVILSTGAYNRMPEAVFLPEQVRIVAAQTADGTEIPGQWTLETNGQVPPKHIEARRIQQRTSGDQWREGETVFMLVHAEEPTIMANTGRDLQRISGTLRRNQDDTFRVEWGTITSEREPRFNETPDIMVRDPETGQEAAAKDVYYGGRDIDYGIYGDYVGASLTAHAFDRAAPGLGKFIVVLAAWLFAISTMISWSYYGEQGVVYLFKSISTNLAGSMVLIYKFAYCFAILVTGILLYQGIVATDEALDMWTALGTGVMLVANIPIMWIFGKEAMAAYHRYIQRLDAGEFKPHEPQDIVGMVEDKPE